MSYGYEEVKIETDHPGVQRRLISIPLVGHVVMTVYDDRCHEIRYNLTSIAILKDCSSSGQNPGTSGSWRYEEHTGTYMKDTCQQMDIEQPGLVGRGGRC